MGADLIGYMVIGPKKFDEYVLEKARAYLIRLQGQIDLALNKGEITQELRELVDMSSLGDLHESERSAIEDLDSRFDESLIDEFLDLWKYGCRDSCCRPYKDRQIVFAGEMTWGDTPEGTGYTILEAIEYVGLYKILGLE